MLLQDKKKPSLCYVDVLSMGKRLWLHLYICARLRAGEESHNCEAEKRRSSDFSSQSPLSYKSRILPDLGAFQTFINTRREVQRCKKQQTQQTCLCYILGQFQTSPIVKRNPKGAFYHILANPSISMAVSKGNGLVCWISTKNGRLSTAINF